MTQYASHLITVALRMAGIAGQDKLNGIFEYLTEGHRWQLSIYRTATEFTAETVLREIKRGTEGFIVGIPQTDGALSVLAKSDVPTVLMDITGGNIERRRSGVAFVRNNPEIIGRAAARELLKQGVYKSFGYVGHRSDAAWSHDRCAAYCRTLALAGHVCSVFDLTHFPDSFDDRETIIRWLLSLRKPCGILAACDDSAFEILDACREARLHVPKQVGVLGVNNDPILCENAEPRLSSVQPDFILEGRRAAEIMDRMLSNPGYRNRQNGTVHLVGVRQIVQRDSTRPQSEAGLLVQKAIAYINGNALKGIGVQDVARHLKVSYSLINLRFQKLQRQSIYEAILGVRLNEVRRRLRTTSDPIWVIADACGWKNDTSLKNLFKRRFGISMREYRLAGEATPWHRTDA